MLSRRFLVLALLACLGTLGCRGTERPDVTFVGMCMGTSWKVTVVRDGGFDEAEVPQLRAAVEAELDGVDASMSTWRPDSELSRFNRAEPGVGVELSDATWEVLDLAREVHDLTGGAFDPTVLPLVRAFGFGGGEAPTAPSAEELEQLRARIGLELLIDRRPILDKSIPGVEVDLSAVAKGYAVDRVHDALVANGVERFLVEVGGELRVRGERPGGGPWRVGVEDPRTSTERVPYAVVSLSDGALATSGDYRNTVELDGAVVSHLFDPRIARPVSSHVASASVLASTCARADALATALAVLGGPAAVELSASAGNFEVFVVERDGERLVEHASPGFERCRVPLE
jgi:FAD:protein FMN transferase